jgi:hypothetical protein
MEPSHPAESNLWYVAIGGTLIAFIFFTVIGDSKLLFLLRFIALALFIAAVTGALVADVLLKHAYWVEARQRHSDD